MRGNYSDMIDLPRHISKTRKQMPTANRAAQFAPFAALTGLEGAMEERGRRTLERPELDEHEKALLDVLLKSAFENSRFVTITYFVRDERKSGGALKKESGRITKIDGFERTIVLDGKKRIPADDVTGIDHGDLPQNQACRADNNDK